MWEHNSRKADILGQPLKTISNALFQGQHIQKTTGITENDFYTIVFKMELDTYMKRKSMLKENTQKTYYMVLGQCNDLIKIKLNQSKGWIK